MAKSLPSAPKQKSRVSDATANSGCAAQVSLTAEASRSNNGSAPSLSWRARGSHRDGVARGESSQRAVRFGSPPSGSDRSALLGRVRQKDTAPEVVVQEILTRLGHVYSTNVRGMPGSPDIVATAQPLVVFVHGCFWHRHQGCPASSTPKTNIVFWKEKFDANVRRDRRHARALRRLGYRVITVWECQTKVAARRARLERRLNKYLRDEK